MEAKRFVTDIDYDRLLNLIQSFKVENSTSGYLKMLWYELKNLKMIQSKKVPPDVVTMNSQVLIQDTKSLEETVVTLVYPADSDSTEKKVSIVTPLGIALFGSKEGDVVEYKGSPGAGKHKILKIIYQPEKFGDFHL